MKILKRSTKKRRVRQRRQLQWQRDVRMTILYAVLETKEDEKELYRLARPGVGNLLHLKSHFNQYSKK